MSTEQELISEYESLKKSKLKQQKIKGWLSFSSMSIETLVFLCFGLFFLILGILIMFFSNKMKEIKYRYDNICKGQSSCDISLSFGSYINSKILIYYQIENFAQNNHQYINSKSDSQLTGKFVSLEEITKSGECNPAKTNNDMGKLTSVNGNPLNPNDVAIPCGLLAKYFFEDEFVNWSIDGKEIEVNEKDIAVKKGRSNYKNIDLSKQWIDMTNEHFMVWMRPASFTKSRKLWGRIDNIEIDEKSIIKLTIKNKSHYDTAKYLILTTTNLFGGKNMFMGVSYTVLGLILLIITTVLSNCFNSSHKKRN